MSIKSSSWWSERVGRGQVEWGCTAGLGQNPRPDRRKVRRGHGIDKGGTG